MKLNENTCDVCGMRESYGCGHSSAQRAQARRHLETKAHKAQRCYHFTSSACDGWVPPKADAESEEDYFKPRKDFEGQNANLCMRVNRWNFPWECEETFDDYEMLSDIKVGLERRHDARFVFVISMEEHGGVSFSALEGLGPYNCSWDSGLAGVAYVTNKAIEIAKQNQEIKDIYTWAKQVVDAELEEYQKYVNGEVYAWSLKNVCTECGCEKCGTIIDSCGGYYLVEDALQDARLNCE